MGVLGGGAEPRAPCDGFTKNKKRTRLPAHLNKSKLQPHGRIPPSLTSHLHSKRTSSRRSCSPSSCHHYYPTSSPWAMLMYQSVSSCTMTSWASWMVIVPAEAPPSSVATCDQWRHPPATRPNRRACQTHYSYRDRWDAAMRCAVTRPATSCGVFPQSHAHECVGSLAVLKPETTSARPRGTSLSKNTTRGEIRVRAHGAIP